MDVEPDAGGPWPVFPVLLLVLGHREDGQRDSRRPHLDNRRPDGLHHHRHLDLRHTGGHILRGAPALGGRLPVHPSRLLGAGGARLPARPRAHVHGLRLLRPGGRRPLLGGLPGCPLERSQDMGHVQASLDSSDRPGEHPVPPASSALCATTSWTSLASPT